VALLDDFLTELDLDQRKVVLETRRTLERPGSVEHAFDARAFLVGDV